MQLWHWAISLKVRRPALYAAASMRANTNASASSMDV
jgi:hypothetical protein